MYKTRALTIFHTGVILIVLDKICTSRMQRAVADGPQVAGLEGADGAPRAAGVWRAPADGDPGGASAQQTLPRRALYAPGPETRGGGYGAREAGQGLLLMVPKCSWSPAEALEHTTAGLAAGAGSPGSPVGSRWCPGLGPPLGDTGGGGGGWQYRVAVRPP